MITYLNNIIQPDKGSQFEVKIKCTAGNDIINDAPTTAWEGITLSINNNQFIVTFDANPAHPITGCHFMHNGHLEFNYNNYYYTHEVSNKTHVTLGGADDVQFTDLV
ncbi:hypothetical protein [Candidatus Tisiphia endosymbiont of Hybos culiciformis]|uniref:hypothetical protein n=1 Tax=Candidatus Tisiphia endosymbiont of Hybos culiciformis TaxID=3139331 RepID=UPI003CCAFC8B